MKNPDSLREWTTAMERTLNAYLLTGTKPWDARTILRDLVYQVGGIMKLDMQLHHERHPQGKSPKALRHALEMELAEVVGLSLIAAKSMKLDIGKGFHNMLSLDKQKIRKRRTKRRVR